MNRVVFLDIDGPLSPDGVNGTPEDPIGYLSARHVELFDAWLTAEGGPAVILSSSWRDDPGFELADRLWAARGLTHPAVGATPFWRVASGWGERGPEEAPRGHTIGAWLKNHPEVTHAVALDDDPSHLMKPVSQIHVPVSPRTGLVLRNCRRASQVLARPMSAELRETIRCYPF